MFGTFKLKEGSDEARTRRQIRRHLNKKKDEKRREHVDESAVNEMEFRPGSMGHMMTAVHHAHVEGRESPDYHIHNIGHHDHPETGRRQHHFLLIHKSAIATPEGMKHPAHVFIAGRNEQGQHEVTHQRQIN